MGTKVHCESYLPGYYSMRDPNEGSSSSNWPLICGDKSIRNGQYNNGYLSTNFSNSYLGADRDAVKQKMLEHEAVFKHQVFELHRLYKTQKDLMEEMKRKELYEHRMKETSSSSSPLVSQMHSENAWKYKKTIFSSLNSNPVVDINSPPLSSARETINQETRVLSQNGCSSKDCEILEVRPSKVRKKLFDLQLPGDQYVDPENTNIGSKLKGVYNGYTYVSSDRLGSTLGLADLNEPVQANEPTHPTTVDLSNSSHFFLGLSKDVFKNRQHGIGNGILNNLHIENKGDRRQMGSYTFEGHNTTNMNFIPQRDYSHLSQKAIGSQLDKARYSSSVLESGHDSGDLCQGGERIVHGLQVPEITRDLSSLYHLKPMSTFTQKLLGASNKSSQTFSQHQDILNRLYNGPPPSWAKDPPAHPPLTIFENSKFTKYDKVASERSINYSPSKIAKEINMNACIEIIDVEKERDNQIKALPWMKNEKISEKKIFGVPIFNKSSCTTKESSSVVSTSRDKGKSIMIDINVACDIECSTEIAANKPLIIIEKNGPEKAASFQALFDLNSCITEDEVTLAPSLASTTNKRIMIDLEVLPVPESDDDILPLDEQPRDEAVLTAAEAIISLSSLKIEAPSPDPLLWFADVVESYETNGAKISSNEIDEFEAETMNLIEMTEEEYMPKPLAPDFPILEESSILENGSVSGRSRGRRRRETRRRDFQRDILPGLASLSRHEVSEDIQTFASLMRNTGHVWTPGSRNRARGRGRRRHVAITASPVNNVAEGSHAVVDDVAVCPPLTEEGDIWGETPRRPRRHRGGTGNSPTVNLG